MKLYKSLLFVFFIVLTLAQTNTTVQKKNINLNDLNNITLEKGETKTLTLTIKNLQPDDSLFVQTASPTYDPYEIPIVTLKSDKYDKLCSQQENEFLGICEVPNQSLKENQQFDIVISCKQKCNLKVQAFLSETLEISFGAKINIISQQSIDTLQQLKIQVPENLNFTDISLIATFLNQDDIDEGAQIFVNIGNETAPIPSPEDYMFKGREVWGNGIGVFLSKTEIKAGQWIKILVILGKGVQLQFYSQAVNGDTYGILLNTAYKDFTSEDQTKLYILQIEGTDNLTNLTNFDQKTVQILFVVYSGVPDIKVGFDPEFKNAMDNYDVQGTFSYLITPQIRKQYNYTGRIYIQVQSFWSSNFYLYSFTVSDKFYKIADGIAQINRAQPSQIQNYIYESYIVVQENESAVESYKLKIQIISGLADVGVRRCLSLQQNDTLDCILTNLTQLDDQLVKDTFDELNITLRRDWDAYELLFDYDASKCGLYKQFQTLKIFNCEFQIIVFPAKTSNKQLVYSVTMFQTRQQGTLKQAYPYKDFLYSDMYHYYEFSLPDEISKVQQVTFFMTVISGDAAIMGTTNQKFKYMEFSDTISQEDIVLSLFNSLTFKKDKLSNKFYVAVYSYQASDITLSVIVKRVDQSKSNTTSDNTTSTNLTTLYLTQGLSQQYMINQGYENINFAFTSQDAQNITIQLIQIQGTVTFNLTKDDNDTKINCTNVIQPGQQKCTFLAEKYTKYIIHITASKSDIQTFSISYFTADICKKYSFNLPQFVFLAAGQKECSSYSITDQSKSLQIITSFSTIDLLTTNIKFTATFNDNHSIQWTGRQKQITSDQLKQFCKSTQMSNCIMKLEYKGDQYLNQKFYFVGEQVGKQMALFDGIVRKVVDQKMSQSKGKFFYYQVTSMKDSVKIFTTNRDNVGYYIGAKFVDITQFSASPDSLYLPYRQNISTPLQNAYQTQLLPLKGTSVIQIESQKFTQHCKACVILISVYGLSKDSNEANIFEIQVTQTESYLYLGEQQTGFLSEDEIYVYDIYANPDAQSLITIRDFLKQSDKEKNCYTASISQVGKFNSFSISLGEYVVPKGFSTFKVYIQNMNEQICTYQISYSALAKPVTQINSYMPIQIKLASSQINYFLHYHREDTSFQILNYIKSGDVKISANRVSQNITIETLVNKNIEMYDFISSPGDSFLQISNSSDKFAKNSYYMIAVKGDPNVQAQMAIAKGNDPIGLTTYGILKQSLKKGQIQTYVYYSIFDFNVSIPLLFGELRVTVLTPTNSTFYNQTISKSTQIVIPKPNVPQGQFIDYYNDESKFVVKIQAIKDSSYYISIKRKNVSLRVYQGIPMTLGVGQQMKTVQFVNLNADDNISILIQVKDNVSESFNLEVTAQVMKQNQVQANKIDSPVVKKSENSLNYVFKSIAGTYFISLKSNVNSTVSFILVKKKMTHLMSSNVNLFTEKGTFQIYTPGHNLMIVVDTCLSQVQVKASEKYQALQSNGNTSVSPVLLQHANYGGHYVITAQNVEGQYFAQVNPKNPKDNMLYIISYFYYDKSDDMPYKKVDVDPDISYELSADKIIFSLNPVRMLSSKQKFKIVPTYTLYISNNANTTTMNSKCDLNVGFSVSQTTSSQNEDVIKFPIQYKTIANEVGEKTDVYYVSAKVKVKFEGESVISGYTPYIDLAYVKLQLTQSTHTVEYKSETTSNVKYILLWIVVPVIIALILFGLALKFCINKYRMLYPAQLVQEDMGESQDQMKSSQMKPTDSLTNT